ncbi:hypothetical protein EU520_01380 [Candidatus Thorarchaeota archaeon]|nr:MAG: hypothetical protein EU520_01380 [Candidatus Thorarchaeota archaeon]
MMKCFTVHSYKGGTGKTTLAANLAVILAQRGLDVSILDLDFQAPSLHTLFGVTPQTIFINEFLIEKKTHREVLTELGNTLGIEGRLAVGFSNPDVEAIRSQLARDRKWHMQALSQLLKLKQHLEKDGLDYLILDSAPGVHYSSVNAIVLADFTVIVAKIDNFDFDGTLNVLDGLYEPLNKTTYLLFNKVVPPMMEEPRRSTMKSTIEEMFSTKTELIGFLPCYCEVPLGMGSEIHALTQPETPFVKSVDKLANRLEAIEVDQTEQVET